MQLNIHPVTMVDPHEVQDVDASGLGEIEDLGDSYRFTLYARLPVTDGSDVCVVAARVVVAHENLPAILFLAARHIGLSLVRSATFFNRSVH